MTTLTIAAGVMLGGIGLWLLIVASAWFAATLEEYREWHPRNPPDANRFLVEKLTRAAGVVAGACALGVILFVFH